METEDIQMVFDNGIMPSFTCGCQETDLIYPLVLEMLRRAKTGEGSEPFPRDSVTVDLLLFILDDNGLIEHGGTIYVPWRTALGDAYLEKLEEADGDYDRLGFWIDSTNYSGTDK